MGALAQTGPPPSVGDTPGVAWDGDAAGRGGPVPHPPHHGNRTWVDMSPTAVNGSHHVHEWEWMTIPRDPGACWGVDARPRGGYGKAPLSGLHPGARHDPA